MTDHRFLKSIFVGNGAQLAVVVEAPAMKRADEDLLIAALLGDEASASMGADVVKGFDAFCGFRDDQRLAAHFKEKIITDIGQISTDPCDQPAVSPDLLPLLLDLLMTEVSGFPIDLGAIVDRGLLGLEALRGGVGVDDGSGDDSISHRLFSLYRFALFQAKHR